MADEPELLMRETQGISSDLHGRAFVRKLVRGFSLRSPVAPAGLVRHIIMTIDPSGGGESHFAIVSCWYHDGMMGVCGLESVCAKRPDDYNAALLEHCRLLRAAYHDAVFVICVEANLGFESSHVNKMLEPVPYTVTMFEAKTGVPGMHTTHQSKEVMWSLLTERLQKRSIAYAKTFVTTAPCADKIKQTLNTQLTNYSVIVDRPDRMNQHFKFARKTFSGKLYGRDDLAVMLQFNCLAHKRWYANPKYRRWW